MRARVAYISSFGTTTILVAAALLILAVGGAIVAFNGWPGSASDAKVDSVSLDPAAPARAATAARARPAAARPAARRPARTPSSRPTARRTASTSGLVKSTPAAGPGSVVPGVVMIQDDGPVAAPNPLPAAQGGGETVPAPSPDEATRIVDPNELPGAGELLPLGSVPLPQAPAVAPDLGEVAGPGVAIEPVTMVGEIIGQVPLPPLP